MGLGPRWSGMELQGPAMCARGPYIEVELLRRLEMKVNTHIAHGVLEGLPLNPDEARNAVTALGAQRLFGSARGLRKHEPRG